jgi:hypothetical protein
MQVIKTRPDSETGVLCPPPVVNHTGPALAEAIRSGKEKPGANRAHPNTSRVQRWQLTTSHMNPITERNST